MPNRGEQSNRRRDGTKTLQAIKLVGLGDLYINWMGGRRNMSFHLFG